MSMWCLVLLTLAVQEPPIGQSPTPATVEGVVVQLGSGEPVEGARVELFGRGAGAYDATTGRDGKFSFPNVTPGTYRLAAAKNGLVVAEYGQRSPGGAGISFNLIAYQRMTGVQLAMATTGSIAGRVHDSDGEPVGRAQVQALRMVYREGRRQLTIAQAVETNDRGEYRLFWLTPGRYYVLAKPDQPLADVGPFLRPTRFGDHEEGRGPFVRSRVSSDGSVVEEAYIPVYYPGTTDLQAAVPVAVGGSAHVAGVDIPNASGLVRTRRIRGFATSAVGGEPLVGGSVIAIPRTSDPNVLIPSAVVEPDGSFELSGVVPGSYIVFATEHEAYGGVALDVGDADVQGLAITASSGFRLSGRFVVDGQARAAVNELRAILTRDPDVLGMPNGGPAFSPPPAEDGSFTLDGVGIGDFRVTVRGLPETAYLKSARMGNADVLDGGLHLFGATRDRLEIVIGTDGGAVTGTVVDSRQEALPNRTVVAVPSLNRRQRSHLYKSTSTDSSGHFRLQGITPGEYKVFAWDTVESGAWQDAEFLRNYENRGRSIQVSDSSHQSLELTAIQ